MTLHLFGNEIFIFCLIRKIRRARLNQKRKTVAKANSQNKCTFNQKSKEIVLLKTV